MVANACEVEEDSVLHVISNPFPVTDKPWKSGFHVLRALRFLGWDSEPAWEKGKGRGSDYGPPLSTTTTAALLLSILSVKTSSNILYKVGSDSIFFKKGRMKN